MQFDIATFSIAAADPASGQVGVAVASKFLAVGAYVPFVRIGVGAVATQARTNLNYGPQALDLLEKGLPPEECSRRVRQDDADSARRQLGIVAASGQSHSFTGSSCTSWAGGTAGDGYAIQGNILTGPQVIQAMEERWLAGTDLDFADRLLAALQAGEDAGGDSRGRQAAALLAAGGSETVDLRVDDAAEPLTELARLLTRLRELQR